MDFYAFLDEIENENKNKIENKNDDHRKNAGVYFYGFLKKTKVQLMNFKIKMKKRK
jgi:hypothetical protein